MRPLVAGAGAWIGIGALFFTGFLLREYTDHKKEETSRHALIEAEALRLLEMGHSPDQIEAILLPSSSSSSDPSSSSSSQ